MNVPNINDLKTNIKKTTAMRIPRNLHDGTDISVGKKKEKNIFSGSEITTDRYIKCENKRGIWSSLKPYYIIKTLI